MDIVQRIPMLEAMQRWPNPKGHAHALRHDSCSSMAVQHVIDRMVGAKSFQLEEDDSAHDRIQKAELAVRAALAAHFLGLENMGASWVHEALVAPCTHPDELKSICALIENRPPFAVEGEAQPWFARPKDQIAWLTCLTNHLELVVRMKTKRHAVNPPPLCFDSVKECIGGFEELCGQAHWVRRHDDEMFFWLPTNGWNEIRIDRFMEGSAILAMNRHNPMMEGPSLLSGFGFDDADARRVVSATAFVMAESMSQAEVCVNPLILEPLARLMPKTLAKRIAVRFMESARCPKRFGMWMRHPADSHFSKTGKVPHLDGIVWADLALPTKEQRRQFWLWRNADALVGGRHFNSRTREYEQEDIDPPEHCCMYGLLEGSGRCDFSDGKKAARCKDEWYEYRRCCNEDITGMLFILLTACCVRWPDHRSAPERPAITISSPCDVVKPIWESVRASTGHLGEWSSFVKCVWELPASE